MQAMSASTTNGGTAPTRLIVGLVVGAAIVVGMLGEHVADAWLQPTWIPVVDLAVGWLMVGCGLVAMDAQPSQPAGRRLVLAGFLWFVGTYGGPDRGQVGAIGFAFNGYHDLVLAWLALSFPARWPAWRPARVVLWVVAALYVAQSVTRLAFTVPDVPGALIFDSPLGLLVAWLDVLRAGALIAAGVVMLAQLSRTPARDRPHVGPVLLAGAASAAAASIGASFALSVVGLVPAFGDSLVPVQWAFNVVRIVVPLAILAGVLRLRTARAAIAGAVAAVGATASAGGLRDALATALGDPGLQILAWNPATGVYAAPDGTVMVDADLDALRRSPTRAVVPVDDPDGPLAAILLARPVADDPALVASGVALTRLVVRGERQAARIQEQLDEVSASRARIVDAADAERRRIERDLHDGLQQQMLALAMELRAAELRPEAREAALQRGSAEVLALLEGVRELARGIHPALLSEAGLGPAIQAAADRSPVPAELDLELAGRGSAAAQATAYFVVSEALANVAKHAASATGVWIRADDAGDRIHVRVEDDGPGGADANGGGLTGLADRVAALGGRLTVGARAGGGTSIEAEVPAG